jgi:hypothetical protein
MRIANLNFPRARASLDGMRLRGNRVEIESLEGRRLLAAPAILKVSDAVVAGNAFSVNGGGISSAAADVALSPHTIAPVFEARFNGSGSGVGGDGDIAATGGTATLAVATGVTNSIGSGAPIWGSYGNSSVVDGATGAFNIVTFKPATSGNSLASLTSVLTIGDNTYTALNGAFDCFVRPNAITAGDSTWFRPVDLNSKVGTSGLRLVFNGTSSGDIRVELSSGGIPFSNYAKTNGTQVGGFVGAANNIILVSNAAQISTPGTTYHVGFTFNTDPGTGVVTLKLFGVTGTDTIDTTSKPLVSAAFKINGTIVGNMPLGSGPWTMSERSSTASWTATSVDYDSVRLYNRDPGSFIGLAPPANAIHPQILQTDKDGHYMVARAPATLTSSVYDIWVKNADGWSNPSHLNAARALYMSEKEAYYSASNPIKIEVVGRNFARSEFGGIDATQVRLTGISGVVYDQTITSLNPFNVTFAVGNVPVGTYQVEVSNDNGVIWSRPGSGQTLTIVAPPAGNPDPLGLNVAWARDFRWSSVFNVVGYGATGGDTTNDTSAVQNAVNAAENAGGGVVYFPNGSYYVSHISIGSGVVLQGQDEYGTKLYYNGTGGPGSMISTKGTGSRGGIAQLQGLARLSILMPDPNNVSARPDVFINLGDTNGSMPQRTANRIFVTDVNLTYGYTTGNSDPVYAHRGIGILWRGKERVLFQNNHFVGWCANNVGTYVNEYCMVRNNSYEYSVGYVHDTATYLFAENNTVKIHPEYNQNSHGIFGRANAYMANNYVEGAGDGSFVEYDGEAFCVEQTPSGLFNYGTVNSIAGNTLTVATALPLVNPTMEYGTLSVTITGGTGLGQMRTVTSIAGNAITVAKPFDIAPDNTSKFTLSAPLQGFTVYNNTAKNCTAGILPYGGQFDAVVADNTVIDSVGIYLFAARGDGITKAENSANAYIRITRNTLTGVSRRSKSSSIGIYAGQFDMSGAYDTRNYSTEILGNTIVGDLTKTPDGNGFPPYNGIYATAYIYSTTADGTGSGDITNTLIQDNHLSNLQTGITLTKCDYGQVISGNVTDSTVVQLLRDGGSLNTLLMSDNYSPQGLNITSQGTVFTSTLTAIGSQGSSNINIIRDGITPQLSPLYNGSYDDLQSSLQYDNRSSSSPYIQYFGYTFSGNKTFGKIVFAEGKHFNDGGWFANGSLNVQVRQGGVWMDVASTAVRPYPNGNTKATFGTGFEAYAFNLSGVTGDGIRIYGTAGGSGRYVSIGELEVWALPAAPGSATFTVNDGSVQRSMVTSLTVNFDQPVTLASDAISLTLRGGTLLAAPLVTSSPDGRSYVLTFTTPQYIGNSLADGIYDLTVKAAGVVDAYGQNLIGTDRSYSFHRLFGDISGDGAVDLTDSRIFRSAMTGAYYAAFDYNGDGVVDLTDSRQFRLRNGIILAI